MEAINEAPDVYDLELQPPGPGKAPNVEWKQVMHHFDMHIKPGFPNFKKGEVTGGKTLDLGRNPNFIYKLPNPTFQKGIKGSPPIIKPPYHQGQLGNFQTGGKGKLKAGSEMSKDVTNFVFAMPNVTLGQLGHNHPWHSQRPVLFWIIKPVEETSGEQLSMPYHQWRVTVGNEPWGRVHTCKKCICMWQCIRPSCNASL